MTQKIINKERFEKAQNYEGNYWKSRQQDPVGIIHDLQSPFALAQHLQRKGYLDYTFEKFLDLGCGGLGVGIIWLIQAKEKYGLDPLPILRSSTGNLFIDDFIAKIQDGVRYHQGGGEALPFEDDYFDCVVCNNVLDHVHNPLQILSEVWRVLKPDGLFAFSVDTHSLRTYLIKKLIKAIKPDYGSLPGHPYEWTESQMTKMLREKKFVVQSHIRRSLKSTMFGAFRRTTYLMVKPQGK